MTSVHHILSGILLLALVLSAGIVSAADGVANLSVSKSVIPGAPYETGQPVTWIVTLSNEGPANATNISLSESISGFSGLEDMHGIADLGTYDNTTRLWKISRLDNAVSAYLTVTTVFGSEGTQTNSVTVLELDQESHGNSHADATVVLNRAVDVVIDQPLSVNLSIRPTTLSLNSGGVFTVFLTLGGTSTEKPRIDFADSSLTCSGAEMIRAGVSNRDGGTLIAKFHRQDLENVTNGTGVRIDCSGIISVNGEYVDVGGSDTVRVIGEKKGLDEILYGFMRFLGLEKDDPADSGTEDGENTTPVALNPGQMKKALTSPDTRAFRQNVSDGTGAQNQDAAGNSGNDKKIRENNGNGKSLSDTNAGSNTGNGNKNTKKGDEASNGKSNDKKNK